MLNSGVICMIQCIGCYILDSIYIYIVSCKLDLTLKGNTRNEVERTGGGGEGGEFGRKERYFDNICVNDKSET